MLSKPGIEGDFFKLNHTYSLPQHTSMHMKSVIYKRSTADQ